MLVVLGRERGRIRHAWRPADLFFTRYGSLYDSPSVMRQQEDNGPATAVHREAGALALADPLEVCTLDSVTAAF